MMAGNHKEASESTREKVTIKECIMKEGAQEECVLMKGAQKESALTKGAQKECALTKGAQEESALKEATPDQIPEIFDAFITPNFPEDEIKPVEVIVHLVKTGFYKVLYLDEGGEKRGIAFLTTCPGSRSYLLDYLAVHESCRSKGYGGRILRLCQDYLQGKPMLIETEALFAAKNEEELQQRIRRNQFYRQNGAVMTDACIRMFGVIFTMWILYDTQGMSIESVKYCVNKAMTKQGMITESVEHGVNKEKIVQDMSPESVEQDTSRELIEHSMTKEMVEHEMELHYRFMLDGTGLYEDNAEIPYHRPGTNSPPDKVGCE